MDKVCSKCNIVQPTTAFYKGIAACKSCLSAYHKERYRTQNKSCSSVRSAHSTCGADDVPSPFAPDAVSDDAIRAPHKADDFDAQQHCINTVLEQQQQQRDALETAIREHIRSTDAAHPCVRPAPKLILDLFSVDVALRRARLGTRHTHANL